MAKCSECDGEGKIECPRCEGSGIEPRKAKDWGDAILEEADRTVFGSEDCSKCDGEKEIDCPHCGGSGEEDDE